MSGLTNLAIHYLQTFTYKPGYRFDVTRTGEEELLVVLRAQVPNSDYNAYVPSGDKLTAIGYTAVIRVPAHLGEINLRGYLDEQLLHMVIRFEQHEAFEWLKQSGRRVRPPHGPGIDPDPPLLF